MKIKSDVTEVCSICAGNNGMHATDCTQAPAQSTTVPDPKLRETQMALAVDRISKALAATPMDIALGALAIVVGQAQYALSRKDAPKRNRNMDTFMQSVAKAINMTLVEEGHAEAQREATQKSDPIRTLN